MHLARLSQLSIGSPSFFVDAGPSNACASTIRAGYSPQDGETVEKVLWPRLRQSFYDPNIAIRAVVQCFQRRLVAVAVVSLDGLLHTVEFDDDDTLHQPGFIDLRGTAANQKSAASGLNRWAGEPGVCLERSWIRNRTIRVYPIRFAHARPRVPDLVIEFSSSSLPRGCNRLRSRQLSS